MITHMVAFVVGVVATWIFLWKNPLWINPWKYMWSHKADAKALLREQIDKL